jgi:ribosomal protein S18 acetylase RimI-like enzyme
MYLKKFKPFITAFIFLVLTTILLDSLLRGENLEVKYGLNIGYLAGIFIAAEVFFNLGIVIMLKASGFFKLRLSDIIKFNFENIRFEGNLFVAGFFINRLAAIVPWLYLLSMGWQKLPAAFSGLVILEIFIVLLLTLGVMEVVSKKVKISEATIGDIDEIIEVEKKAWPEGGAATREQFEKRIKIFNEGVIIAKISGKVVGVVAGELIQSSYLNKESISWSSITDNGYIENSHDPKGDALFGIDLSVDPSYRNRAIGRKLLLQIGRMAVKRNLKCGILGARMPDYYKHSKKVSAKDYIDFRDTTGQLVDKELRFYERSGLKFLKVIPNYFPDRESLNYGVLCVWNNPFYIENQRLGRVVGGIGSLLFKI